MAAGDSGKDVILLENADRILLEDSSGLLLLDWGAMPNNYQFLKVGDGMSATETIK